MDLKAKVEKIDDTHVKLSADVDEKSVSDELNRQYKIYARKYKFPGFRAGKAPRPVVDSAVGKETVYLDATENIVNDAYHKIVEDQDLRPVGEPKFDQDKNEMLVTDKKPFHVQFELEVSPVVELDNYDPIEAYLQPTEATEEEIEAQINIYKTYAGVAEDEELTEEVAKEKMGFESLEKLREAIKGLVENEKKAAEPRVKEEIISLKLAERLSYEPSEGMVDYINTILLNDMFQNLQQYGATLDQYLKNKGLTSEEFYEDVKKQAKDEAKTRIALDAWANHNNLKATESDIDAEFLKGGFNANDLPSIKKDWAHAGNLWRVREAIVREKATQNAIEGAKFTVDEEKAKHQFDYLNKDKDDKTAKTDKAQKEDKKSEE